MNMEEEQNYSSSFSSLKESKSKRGKLWWIIGIIVVVILAIYFIFIFDYGNNKFVESPCLYGCKATYESRILLTEYVEKLRENLYFYNLDTEENMTINPKPSYISHMGFDSENENRIFYMDERKGKYNNTLYIYDLITKKEQEISNFNLEDINLNSLNDLRKVIVSGNMIYLMKNIYPKRNYTIYPPDPSKAWQHLFSYNLETGEEIRLTDTNLQRSCLSKDGKNIIYLENESLILYNLDNQEKLIIEQYPDNPQSNRGYVMYRYCPTIYDNKIIYSLTGGYDSALIKLYLYDISKKEKKVLTEISQPSSESSVIYLGDLRLKEDELKYITMTETLVILDDYEQTFACTSLDLDSLETKDLSCGGGIGSLK